jgi:cytoskeletal protein CcmA (bactofilin family)
VEITATGKVFGNIAAHAIVVDEGATFRGASKMSKPEESPKPASPKSSEPAGGVPAGPPAPSSAT